MDPQYQIYRTITDAVIGFIRALRSSGFHIGVDATLVAGEMCRLGIWKEKNSLKYGLKSLCCKSPEEYEVFDLVFDRFWKHIDTPTIPPSKKSFSHTWTKKANASIVYLGANKTKSDVQEKEESKQVSGASHMERLKKTDFSKLPLNDLAELEKLAEDLYDQLSKRMRKKWIYNQRTGRLHMRRTIRQSMAFGGVPMRIGYQKKVVRKPRLCVLLDMSGSMDTYSFYLLKFVFALQSQFELLESFAFSTSLVRLTESLQENGLEETLNVLGNQVKGWSGGTLIGKCLAEFNAQFAPRILNGKSVVIILSDGLETGKTETLIEEVRKIKQRTKKLIWLNPLKGMLDYQPETKAMKSILDDLDVFASAHSLHSLLDLENHLANV